MSRNKFSYREERCLHKDYKTLKKEIKEDTCEGINPCSYISIINMLKSLDNQNNVYIQ
jgi:hypothetical protein